VSHAGLRRAAFICGGLAALIVLIAGGARAALVETGDIVLHADAAFEPRSLPRHGFAPIEIEGHLDIDSKGGGKPVALQRLVIGFDRDGHLSAGQLPACLPEQIANASVEEARQICRGAMVGTGHLEATVSLSGGTVPVTSPLTIFNGPRQNGSPSALVHAQTTVPATQIYAVVVPIEKQRGEFRYRATLDVPPIAAGLGALTHIDVDISRRFRAGGKPRSYVSGRCSDGILRTSGDFTFADGTIIEGAVEKFCRARDQTP
jgi:hypothetical protein